MTLQGGWNSPINHSLSGLENNLLSFPLNGKYATEREAHELLLPFYHSID